MVLVALTAGSLLAARLKLSAIPVFIVAGVLLGPDTPLGWSPVGETRGVEVISELGVILLLFFLGLEFSLERLQQARRLVLVGGLIDVGINGLLGGALGVLLFGPGVEALLFAGLFYISSSGIVSQALFDLQRLGDDETDLTLGVLVFEDFAVAIFLAVAGALAVGGDVSALQVGGSGLLSILFIAAFLVASRYAGRVLGPVISRLTREQLFLFAVTVAVGAGVAAQEAHLSDAVGALLAGVLLSGTEIRDQIEQQLMGLRDFAAAIFFLAFGLSVDLGGLGMVWVWLLVAVPAAIIGKTVAGFLAGRITGFTARQSLNVGAALVARGEFTIILAQMAAAGTALSPTFRDEVPVFAGIFVLSTAVAGVVLMRESRRLGRVLFPGASPARRRRSGVQRHG